jgi:hypothetical protein
MKFPNSYKGIKLIYLAEILMLLVAVLSVIEVFIVAGNGVVIDNSIIVSDGTLTVVRVIGIAVVVMAVVAFLVNLVGVVSCRNDDDSFKFALFATIAGIIFSIVKGIPGVSAALGNWMDTLNSLASLFASYFILTGVANLSDAYPDPRTKALCLKSRNLLCCSLAVSAILRCITGIFGVSQTGALWTIMGIVAVSIEIISYVVYLAALQRSKHMLSK